MEADHSTTAAPMPIPQPSTSRPWVHVDVLTSTQLSTTGGEVWKAAERLVQYLEAVHVDIGLDKPGARILELGAGCGYLGLTVAANLPAAGQVVLTEQEGGGACDWLAHNVQRGTAAHGLDPAVVRAKLCDWARFAPPPADPDSAAPAPPAQEEGGGDAAPGDRLAGTNWDTAGRLGDDRAPHQSFSLDTVTAEEEWDFVLGSDLIYNEVGVELLPQVLAAAARGGALVLYAHTRFRFEAMDIDFLHNLTALGLRYQEVWEPGAASPPPSPPPLTELFPETRIAIYKIWLDEGWGSVEGR